MPKSTADRAVRRTAPFDARDPLAASFHSLKSAAIRSARLLHDDVGPLLSAAGLHLQLVRMDHPEAEATLRQVTELLDQAMDRIRAVSQDLAPSPVLRGGLKNALARLVDHVREQHPEIMVKLDYTATASISEVSACELYEAAAGALALAVESVGALKATVLVRGSRTLSVRITDNGRPGGRLKALQAIRRSARLAGIVVTISTRRGTIVLIRDALRRSASGRSQNHAGRP